MKRYFWVAICILIALVVVSCDDHVHTYSDEWTYDKDYHWHAATCEHKDAVKDKAEHVWDEGKITTPATKDKAGVKTYTCTICKKATKTEEISFCEKHTMVEHEAKAATCTEKGWEAYEVCSVCGYSTYKEIAATGHDYKCVATADKAKHHKVCSNCNAVEAGSEEDHKYGEWEKVDDSNVKRTCSECENIETVEGITVSSEAELTEAVKKNVSVYLTSDIELKKSVEIGSSSGEKITVVINMNGKTVSGKTGKTGTDGITINNSLFIIENAAVTFDGSGTIQDTGHYYGGICLVGSSEESKTDYTILTVNKGITIKDGQAVWVNKNKDGNYVNHGVVANFSGTADLSEIEDYAFYVNGQNVNEKNVPVFNIKGAIIKSKGLGIYAAGYAVWNIEDTSIEGVDSAIEIRAGELNIVSGTYSASASPASVTSNGNGTTTSGAAIAVAQHTTKLPISVKITGGEFTGYHAMSVLNAEKGNKTDSSKPTAADCKKVTVEVSGGKFTAFGTSGDKAVDTVNVDEYFEISADAKYDAPASFKVSAKTTTE